MYYCDQCGTPFSGEKENVEECLHCKGTHYKMELNFQNKLNTILEDNILIKEALCSLLYNSDEEDADMDKKDILKRMGYVPGTAHYYGENDPPEEE